MESTTVSGKKRPGRKPLCLDTIQRKKRRADRAKQHFDRGRIRIGANQHSRWALVKSSLCLKNDSEVAKMLLDSFDRLQASEEGSGIEVIGGLAEQHSLVQTEVESKVQKREQSHETAQSTSGGSSGVNLEYVQDGDVVYVYPPTASQQDQGDFSDEDSEEEDDATSFLQLLEEIDECHPDCGVHDATLKDIFDMEDSSHHSAFDEDDIDRSPPIVDVKSLATEDTFLGYTSSLRQLLGEISVEPCLEGQCGCIPLPVMKTIGTAVTVRWVCRNGHVAKTWSSQPKLQGNHAGDVALSSAIVLSGSSLPKVKMLCRCLNLGTCSEALHKSVQEGCMFPTVRSYWEKVQNSVLTNRKYKEITIAAGTKKGTHNQPSTFSPFISMDYRTGDILNVSTIENRSTQQDPGPSELEAFTQTMDLAKNSNITVHEVVTDPQQDFQDYMRQHPAVLHSLDVWQGAKEVGRKVAMASQRSEFYRPLERWIGEVTKHFMICSQQAQGERMAFIAHWRGILHHVIGKHQWILGDGYGPAKCLHDPILQESELEQDRLLQPGSLSHSALGEIVFNRPFLINLDYYSRNRHMSCLERFWPYLDAYVNADDMHSRTACETRFLLAAIDFQVHKDRSQQMSSGSPVFTRQYNRTTKRSVKVPAYEKKSYSYIQELMQEIFMKSLVKEEAGV